MPEDKEPQGNVNRDKAICGGTFGFGGIEGDAAVGGGFSGAIVETDSIEGVAAGTLNEGWIGGEIVAVGAGKITSNSEPGVLQGWFGFIGASISAGPLAGMQAGIDAGKGWRGVYLEGHVGPWALGTGAYLRTSCSKHGS
ncbi:MAG: hypothetical protein ABIQ86_13300 [Steroidobacteraceae bacterium]